MRLGAQRGNVWRNILFRWQSGHQFGLWKNRAERSLDDLHRSYKAVTDFDECFDVGASCGGISQHGSQLHYGTVQAALEIYEGI